MNNGSDPSFEPHGRAHRRVRRQRNRRIAIAVLVAIALVGGSVYLVLRGGDGSAGGVASSPPPNPGTSNLMIFGVDADQPFTAIVGTGGGRAATIVAVPYNLLTTIPGVGSGTIASAMRESGSFGRTALSNLLGVWIPHYAQISMKSLSEMVSKRGGLTVDLPRVIQIAGHSVGPGPTKLSGPQVASLLEEGSGGERNLRWESVLHGLFARTVSVPKDSDSDDPAASDAGLVQARGAVVSEFPSSLGAGGYRSSDPNATKAALDDLFGIHEELPTPVVLFSGVDRPKLAQSVTADLVPAGYRVVSYQDARGLDRRTYPHTLIYATEDSITQAQKVKQTLGVGRVFLNKQGSGLAGITVIAGKDYLANIGG